MTDPGVPAALRPCPTCGGPVAVSGPHRPFCSDRCRLVDLGRWLRGEYVVEGPSRPAGPPGEEPR